MGGRGGGGGQGGEEVETGATGRSRSSRVGRGSGKEQGQQGVDKVETRAGGEGGAGAGRSKPPSYAGDQNPDPGTTSAEQQKKVNEAFASFIRRDISNTANGLQWPTFMMTGTQPCRMESSRRGDHPSPGATRQN